VIHAQITRSYESLKEAGVERASTLVCAFDDDADNLLVAMNARKMTKDIRILMTVQDRDLVDSTIASDIDFVLPVFDLLAKLLAVSAVAEEISGPNRRLGQRDDDTFQGGLNQARETTDSCNKEARLA